MKNKKTTAGFAACIAGFAAALSATAGFVHEMPKATNETPLDTPYAEMAETFKDPFGKVQTGCYWYWYHGNVSVEGVKKDLEAMKRVGIDRAYIGDIGKMNVPHSTGPVEIFSPEWEKAVAASFETATKLGIELGLFNGPGWSMAGGPWVDADRAARRFVSSSLVVEGPKENVRLPLPEYDYRKIETMRDVVVVAYPLPKRYGERLEKKNVALDGDGKSVVVELSSATPFAAQSAVLEYQDGKAAGTVVVEAEVDGKWKRLGEAPYSRTFGVVAVGFTPRAPIIVTFQPTEAKRFRLTLTPNGKHKAKFSAVSVCGAQLVEKAFEKSLAKMFEQPTPLFSDYKWSHQTPGAPGTALDPAKAVLLKGKVAADGTLDWKVPAGKWLIYRFAVAPTGTKNGPAFGVATGLEADKMDAEHMKFHFDSYIGKLLDLTTAENRKSVRYTIMDSWETGSQNFTDNFSERFKAAFGYDPTPYLPALFGMAVADRVTSDRVLWDLRRFVADEVAYSFVGGLRKVSNAKGMETWLENYGHWGFPGDFLLYGGHSDEVAGEFGPDAKSNPSKKGVGDVENRGASSCAHIYGKRLAWAESFTSARREFARAPMDLKLSADRFFAEGLNATILHVYLHQPDERKPGINAWFGTEFNRHNTWFDHLDLFTGYLKRCGWMLRQGLNVADIAYFIGEDAPCMEGDIYSVPPPAGRQFDYINAEVLTETATVDAKGRIVLPHGTAYEVLVLPELETMRPKMIECIERLVNAGAFVLGPKPKRSPSLSGQPQSDAKVKEIADRLWGEEECKVESVKCKVRKYGKGVIASDISLDEALKMRGSEPDVILHSTLYTLHSSLAYAHRTMPNAEIYFVSNQSGEEIPSVEVSFRVSGRTPELWDAAMGTRRAAEKWSKDGKRSAVTLSLAKNESVFVVFPAEKGNGEWGTGNRLNPVNSVKDNLCVGPWTVSFESDALHRGPKEPIIMDKLIDLSTSSDPSIKFYSGRITYKTKFTVPRLVLRSLGEGGSLPLSLGDVSVTAKVKVNGKYAGGVCFAPYRIDIAPFVKEGENELEIEVCNLWVNRLVGDDGMENRPTWTYKACCDTKTKLPKSGLIGPVRIGADASETLEETMVRSL